MLNERTDDQAEEVQETPTAETPTETKPAETKPKKPKAKAAASIGGQVHVVLDFANATNGTFRLVAESDLNAIATELDKNSRLKLLRGEYLKANISISFTPVGGES